VQIVLKSGSLNFLEPSGPVQACNGIALPLPLPCLRKELQEVMYLDWRGLAPYQSLPTQNDTANAKISKLQGLKSFL